MTTTQQAPAGTSVFNVPNQLTALRLVLAIVLFVLIGLAQYYTAKSEHVAGQRLYLASTIVFLIAAGTDWLDGFWARRYGQVTMLGRIFDPFVDKVVVCGAFIFLVASPGSGIEAWMAVVVVARELLVTALRSHVERLGMDFSANMAGKLKMVVQCAAAAASLGLLSFYTTADSMPTTLRTILMVLVWAAVAITIYSGAGYVLAAARLLRRT